MTLQTEGTASKDGRPDLGCEMTSIVCFQETALQLQKGKAGRFSTGSKYHALWAKES